MPDTATGNKGDSRVAFLYASQTGNAESISYTVYEEAVKRGYTAEYHVLNDYKKFKFDELRTAVFVVSTTGDGDPPDNSARFWRALKKTARDEQATYSHLRYAILGLGDTNYSNFCNTAQRLDKQLGEAGATAFYPTGLADDATGLEEVVEPWIEGLWPALAKELGSSDSSAPAGDGNSADGSADSTADAMAKLNIDSSTAKADDDPAAASSGAPSAYAFQPLTLDFRPMATLKAITGAPRIPAHVCTIHRPNEEKEQLPKGNHECPPWNAEITGNTPTQAPFLAPIKASQRVTGDKALKRTLVVDLDVSEAKNVQGEWCAGDSFNIYARNDPHMVSALLDRIGVGSSEAQRPVFIRSSDDKIKLPAHLSRFSSTATTICAIFEWAVDITASPRKQLLRALADHCSEPVDKDRMLYVSSRQGVAAFDELRRQGPALVDILHAFPSCVPPAERLLDLLPPLAPRSYSICNAPQSNAGIWRFAFNVVEYELEVVDPFSSDEDSSERNPVRINRRGVCTPWLEHLCKAESHEPPSILVSLRPNLNGFRLPPPSDPRPVLMVGPGTGVAPFIGFLEQRAAELEAAASSKAAPLAWLFFGCRSSTEDYLFKDDIEKQRSTGVLDRLSVCFSRDPDARKKLGTQRYVQEAMLLCEDEIGELLVAKDAMVFVCGDAKGMAKDVNNALADILCSYSVAHPACIDRLLPDVSDPAPLTKVQAIQILGRWASERRYVRDLWA
ncbi:hypothetical protein IW140_002498 [Coemansia sp. RSA 1813]|nr:hypothetical protein LPJ74_002876 [Coemansia sp. RSA 1843]KAJ2215933.1 hypothetical protein EV179_001761 [Coemansia sp. RSA 487]KAJ2570222.1 hypothetical protein IW140_002498 [Coemansia sp. RSA 1813]